MAEVADKVVVELIAKNDQFDANVRASSNAYQKSMKDIETAGGAAEVSHQRLTASVGNSRIAMMEFQHIARGTADQIAAGAPLTQVLAQHMGMLAQAVSLAGGAFGTVGEYLAGPWGLVLTVAVAGIAMLINRHKEENDTLESTFDKLVKHKRQTELSSEADAMWGRTLDGLIERLKKTNDELGKRLTLQPVANQQAFANAAATVAALSKQIDDAERTMDANDPRLKKLHEAFSQAVRQLYQDTLIVGEQQGAALSDMNKRVDEWIALQQNHLRYLEGAHPELLASAGFVSGAFDTLKKALSDAVQAGVPIGQFTDRVDTLNQKLADSPSFIKEYIADLKAMAAQIEDTAAKAKDAPKSIEDFKKAVIGAEGTGPNRLGSSAAGFGQFMPSTWLSYFNKLFPGKADLDDAAKLEFRNVKDVAMAVIDAATKDYVAVIKAAGQQITAANLYAVHLLGQRDAKRLFAADSGTDTSSFLSAGVLRGNPFLRGTAGDARAAIAQRIGDSSSAVSAAAATIQQTLDRVEDQMSDRLHNSLGVEREVTVAKEGQAELSREILASHVTLESLIKSGILPSLKDWEKEYAQIKASQQEINRFGAQLVDDILNPDNWHSWGQIGKTVLHDLEREFLTLAAINPLKNLLFGANLPTLQGVLGGLGSIFGGSSVPNISSISAFGVTLPGTRAAGGPVSAGSPYLVGENGPELFVPRSMGTIIPNNATAGSPWGGGGGASIVIGVEASEYFDARVVKVTDPRIGQAAAMSANGGATLARRNLARESQHRLEA